jgi:hypothetical protein
MPVSGARQCELPAECWVCVRLVGGDVVKAIGKCVTDRLAVVRKAAVDCMQGVGAPALCVLHPLILARCRLLPALMTAANWTCSFLVAPRASSTSKTMSALAAAGLLDLVLTASVLLSCLLFDGRSVMRTPTYSARCWALLVNWTTSRLE